MNSPVAGPSSTFNYHSILGRVLPLQEAAFHCGKQPYARVLQLSPDVLCYPCPYPCLLPHDVISPTTFSSSNWSYTHYLPLCASIVFHQGDVSSPFPFRISYILDYVCDWFFAKLWCHGFCLSTWHTAFSIPRLAGLFQVSLLMLL